MQLTLRGLGLLLIAAPLLALATWWPLLAWGALIWLMVVVALLVADWQLAPAPAKWTLARRHDDRLSLAAQNRIVVRVELRGGQRPVPIWLRDTPPATFRVAEEARVIAGTVPPGAFTELAYDAWPPRRGDYLFGDLYLRWATPLGLLRRQARYPAAESVKVYPNLVEVRKYDLLLRRNRLWELGLRTTRVLGSGAEFERLRDYTPDDEYRRINWKATARRARPITMEYETERSQNIFALLDVGRVMRSPVGDVAKMDYAINAVLLLTYVAVQKGDRVGLLTFADSVQTWVAPRSGKAQFHRLLEQLYAVEGQPVEPNFDAALSYFAAHHHKRGLVLVFTDLTGGMGNEGLIARMVRLRRNHLPLLVTVADPTVEHLARQPIADSTTLYERTAAEQLLQERKLVLDRLRQQGVNTLDVPADELSVAVINRYLELKARTQI